MFLFNTSLVILVIRNVGKDMRMTKQHKYEYNKKDWIKRHSKSCKSVKSKRVQRLKGEVAYLHAYKVNSKLKKIIIDSYCSRV